MEFDVHISEEVLRKASLHRLFRRWRVSVFILVFILVTVQRDWRNGGLGALSIFCLSGISLLFLIYGAVYIRDGQSIADWKKLQGDEAIRYELSQGWVRASSKMGSTEVRWEAFKELLLADDYLLFSMGRMGHLTLPRREIPAKALEFIYEQMSLRHRPVRKAWK